MSYWYTDNKQQVKTLQHLRIGRYYQIKGTSRQVEITGIGQTMACGVLAYTGQQVAIKPEDLKDLRPL